MGTEADACRKYVLPRLIEAVWDEALHSFTEQRTITDGRIVVAGSRVRCRPQKRAGYLLRYTRDCTIAVVQAKADCKTAGGGLQQAKPYAEMLGLQFAHATNGEATSSTTIPPASRPKSRASPRRPSCGGACVRPRGWRTRRPPGACSPPAAACQSCRGGDGVPGSETPAYALHGAPFFDPMEANADRRTQACEAYGRDAASTRP